jgi:hypothetical protein
MRERKPGGDSALFYAYRRDPKKCTVSVIPGYGDSALYLGDIGSSVILRMMTRLADGAADRRAAAPCSASRAFPLRGAQERALDLSRADRGRLRAPLTPPCDRAAALGARREGLGRY